MIKSEELFLLRFTGYTKKQRELGKLNQQLKDTFKAINHNNNGDITIPSKKYEQQLNQQVDNIREKMKALEKKVKKDFDVNHYIELEEKTKQENKPSNITKSDFFG